jgi:hypothetical protein
MARLALGNPLEFPELRIVLQVVATRRVLRDWRDQLIDVQIGHYYYVFSALSFQTVA